MNIKCACNSLLMAILVCIAVSQIVVGDVNCTSEEFLCEGRNSYPNACIDLSFVCDGIMDCYFGQDEFNCNECNEENGFICQSTGDCISLQWKCDGIWDCKNQEDETPQTCPELNANCLSSNQCFICNNTNNRCISSNLVCDGADYDGCIDGQDEHNCPAPTSYPTKSPTPRLRRSTTIKTYRMPCKRNQIECKGRGSFPSYCIASNLKCDGYSDCMFGEDEWNCGECDIINGFICEQTGDCIPNEWVCDSVWDCPNQEDELPAQCNSTYSQCLNNPNNFICNNTNGLCISSIYVCNGINYDGCLDGQEETNCA